VATTRTTEDGHRQCTETSTAIQTERKKEHRATEEEMEEPTSSGGLRNRLTRLTLHEHDDDDVSTEFHQKPVLWESVVPCGLVYMKLKVAFRNCFANASNEFAVYWFVPQTVFLGHHGAVWPAGEPLHFIPMQAFVTLP
jgi:hypothetical protein